MCAVNFLAVIPEIFLSFSICLLVVFGVVLFPLSVHAINFSDNYFDLMLNKRRLFNLKIKQLNLNSEISRRLINVRGIFFRVGFLSLLILFLTGYLCFNFNLFTSVTLFLIDGYCVLIKLLVLGISFILLGVILVSKKAPFIFETFIFILLVILGLFCLISSYDFLIFYLALELQSFSLYILASLNRTSEFSTEAGLKYFVLGAFSSGLILFGCSFIYGFSGITNFGALQLIFSSLSLDFISLFSNAGFCLGFIFILVGLLFKIGAAPFHM
jgi:NADH:ubiquinone oxidoreductase subunit 2 (subunit N)